MDNKSMKKLMFFKAKICNKWVKKNCSDDRCRYAHGKKEMHCMKYY